VRVTANVQQRLRLPESDRGAPARRFGAIRLVVALLIVASIATQVVQESIYNDFMPLEYFSYFTVQSSLIDVVILTLSGLMAALWKRESTLLGVLRVSVVSYAIVTAVVYNVWLRALPDDGYVVSQWPNEIIHVAVPLFLLVDWLVAPGRPVLRVRDVRIVLIFPLVWLAFTFVRGTLDGWFPYPFLLRGRPDSWFAAGAYVLGISAFIVTVTLMLIALSRARWANTDRLWGVQGR